MEITKNLQLETRRLNKLGVVFRMFEQSPGMVGIVIRESDATPENLQKVEEAGYVSSGKSKKDKAMLYEISIDELGKIHSKMLKLLELECKRIATIGDPFFRYRISNDGEFVINVLEDGSDDSISIGLTEMGYSSRSWNPRGDIAEYVIPISYLEELYGISVVDTSD